MRLNIMKMFGFYSACYHTGIELREYYEFERAPWDTASESVVDELRRVK